MKLKTITNSSKNGTLVPYFPGWLEERFPGHYAQIGTVNTLKLKMAVKDVARFKLGFVPPDIEQLSKGFVMPPQGVNDHKFIMGYEVNGEHVPGSIQSDKNLQEYIKKYPDHWEIVKEALSLWRSRGRHAAGYVISNEPIDEFIPTSKVSDVKVLDFTGPECEGVGAIKYDFLVVNSLLDIQEACRIIQTRYLKDEGLKFIINGKPVPRIRVIPDKDGNLMDIWDLPPDEAVFKDISDLKTETIFQFDSASARKWLKYFQGSIHSVNDLAIFTALDRPGPLDYFVSNPDSPSEKHNMLVEYSRRAKGLLGSPDVVKELDMLCPDTKGIMVFQESLMKVYQYFTECSDTESDEFRANVGKKKKDKIDQAYSVFMERAVNKVSKETAQAVWESLVTWAKYGFNKSHSVSYCITSYACAYLKHHYPLEWWTAVLRNATKDEVNTKFWMYCGNFVLLPDVSLSKGNWSIEGDKIRAPISLLTGMGDAAHAQLAKSAPYSDLKAFCRAIVEHQKANPITKEKLDKDGTVKKTVTWGRNALDIGKIHSMIVSGVMDSLFDQGLTISEKIDLYHNTMKELYLAEGKKYNRSKKTFPALDALGRYQAKKAVLPPYGEDLRPVLVQIGLPDFIEYDKRAMRMKDGDSFISVIGPKGLLDLETAQDFLLKHIRCGMIGYIEKKESFYYQNKSKQAYKFILEFGGLKREFVVWPDYYSGEIPESVKNVKVGSIIAAIIEKRAGKPDISVKDLTVIREPLDSEEPNKDDTKPE